MPPKKSDRVLFLVDGSALAYRSHFAFIRTPLSNASGLNTGGVLGYTNTLMKILREEEPDHFAVVYDTPEPTFRHKLYPEYKATRDKTPDELIEQLPWMKEVTRALGLPLLELDGYEADDVVATLADRAVEAGFFVYIVTGDKDFMQIVSDRIQMYDIMKSNTDLLIVDEAEVAQKFGVGPDRVIDVLALMGDSSDNVPGVPLIGPKKATELVNKYGSVEAVLDHADEVKGKKTSENLKTFRDQAMLSKRLVTIDRLVPIEATIDDLARREPDSEKAATLFKQLEFNTLWREFANATPKADSGEYVTIHDDTELSALIDNLRKAGEFVFDLETTSLNPRDAEIVGFAFAWEQEKACYVPLNAETPVLDGGAQAIIDRLRPLLEDASLSKVGQNLKYDASILDAQGIVVRGIRFDTMLASYLIKPGTRNHDLDSLSLENFNYKKVKTTELIGKGKDQITMDLVPVETVAHYGSEDADFTYRLFRLFEKKLEEEDLSELFARIEIPLILPLVRMEMNGVRVDTRVLDNLRTEMDTRLQKVVAEIYEAAGREFNIASPKQLGQLLFDELELHKQLGVRPKKTKTGFSTDQSVLERLKGHPLPAKILEHRSLSKLLGTYVNALPELIHEDTGRIHSSFNQAVAATGRLSSSDPNLQNIPVRSAMGRRIREAFVPSHPDWTLLSADYSQIELRIMAEASGDPTLTEAFNRGADIHRDTAARIFGIFPEAVDDITRSRAKAINFGILYGMGPQRLARETGLDQKEAKEFIERYFDMFPDVREFIDAQREKARDLGYVKTLLGRRRPIPDIHSTNGRLRIAAENMAVNTPIQGTAADIIKLAMIEVYDFMEEQKTKSRLILQVHDELVFDVAPEEIEMFRTEIPKIMSGVVEFGVPLVVDVGEGKNWAEAH